MKTSAYMIAHSDDDFLQQAIDSVIDRVDEVIFVDGAYAWVAPFFEQSGIDPTRSWERTHEILAGYGDKVKYFSGIWDDELHKRSFGYSQCSGDIIIRIDADEIFQFDEPAWADFLASDKGVAEMEFPYLVTPTSQRLQAGLDHTPKQCAVFRAAQFATPLEHCAYLWLVLTEEERSRCGAADWSRLYPQPVIRTAHLTGFRTPRTSVNRARFYTLQHARMTGYIGWRHRTRAVANPEDKIQQIFNLLTAPQHTSYLEGHDIVSGFANMNGFCIAPYSFEPYVQAQVDAVYHDYNQAMAKMLDFTRHSRVVVSFTPTMINVTSLIRSGNRRFEIHYSKEMISADGHLLFLRNRPEAQTVEDIQPVHAAVFGKKVHYAHDEVDTSDLIQAILVVCPVANAKRKLRIKGLKPLGE